MPSDLRAARAVERALVAPRVHVIAEAILWPSSAYDSQNFCTWRSRRIAQGQTVCGQYGYAVRLSPEGGPTTCPRCLKVLANWGIRGAMANSTWSR